MFSSLLLSFSSVQEIWIYMPKGRLIRQDNTTSESMALLATTKVDKDVMQALTGDDGPLAAGILPAVKAETQEGQKKLMQTLDESTEVKKRTPPKRKTKEEEKDAERVEPKTFIESKA